MVSRIAIPFWWFHNVISFWRFQMYISILVCVARSSDEETTTLRVTFYELKFMFFLNSKPRYCQKHSEISGKIKETYIVRKSYCEHIFKNSTSILTGFLSSFFLVFLSTWTSNVQRSNDSKASIVPLFIPTGYVTTRTQWIASYFCEASIYFSNFRWSVS